MYEVMKWSWKVKWKLLEFVNRQSWGNTGYFSMVVLQQRKEWLVLNWNRFYAEFWAVLKGKGKKKKLKWNIYFVVKRIPTTKNIWWICSKIAINLWLSQLIFAEYIYTYLKKMNTFSQARNENHMVRKVSKKKEKWETVLWHALFENNDGLSIRDCFTQTYKNGQHGPWQRVPTVDENWSWF